jgi:ATP-dependent exoDNAse (exonuclease V) alpha subunit
MAIYHLEAKVVSRGTGRSAVAASAYMSCSRLYNDYDGIQHDYTRKQGLIYNKVFLPPMAPAAWQDRAALWNAVEEAEKTKDSRLAREFVVALPKELDGNGWTDLLSEFVQENFVADGMCADAAIHDTDGHNPHAHILLTVRPLNENGTWQYKTEKEYLCIRSGEEQGFTAAEFKSAQSEGWEKQYQYKVGKKKVYMPPSEADVHGYERADKHPKSTRYGRQNPISERWNSEDQLVSWRAAWADVSNRHLERAGSDERIDHRSHAARGLDEQPTIHEGVFARMMEREGKVSDRCELNRQIRADNKLLRELKAQVKKLTDAIKNTVPAIADAMERLRRNMLIFKYQVLYARDSKQTTKKSLSAVKPDFDRYTRIVRNLKDKAKERKGLLAEKKACRHGRS